MTELQKTIELKLLNEILEETSVNARKHLMHDYKNFRDATQVKEIAVIKRI